MSGMGPCNHPALLTLLGKQHNVISRAQAIRYGMTDKALECRIAGSGRWQRLLPGAYLTVTGTPTEAQRDMAALLYAGHPSMLTGVAALRQLGIRVPDTGQVTVLVPARRSRASKAYVTIWPTTRLPPDWLERAFIRFARPDRAVADAARELTDPLAIRAVAADAVQQRWASPARLAEELRLGPRRGREPLLSVLAEVADGVRSVAEGDLRILLRRSKIPASMFNARLYLSRMLIAVVDAWWPDAGVAVEIDSRCWHLSPEDWEETMRRHARLSAAGAVVLHFSPDQLRREPGWVTTQIRSTLDAGNRRPPLPIRAVPASG
jgi:very-short-patch-repair endonuclease